MGDELVWRRAEGRMTGCTAVLSAIDIALQMLDADAHGKGLAGEGNAEPVGELKDIACGMAAGEDQVGARYSFRFGIVSAGC